MSPPGVLAPSLVTLSPPTKATTPGRRVPLRSLGVCVGPVGESMGLEVSYGECMGLGGGSYEEIYGVGRVLQVNLWGWGGPMGLEEFCR